MTDPLARLRRFLRELKRRKVYRVAAGYLVAAFVVLQLAGLAADAFGFPGWFQPMVWVLAGLGFPLTLVVAWAFEMTPEGVRRTPETERKEATSDPAEDPRGTRRAVQLLAALGIIAVAGAGIWQFTPLGEGDEGTEQPTPRIAVLPFESISRDSGDADFARGMYEEVLNQLSKVSGLAVVSRKTAMELAESEMTAAEIGREHDVQAILQGSVQRAADRLRIRTQLIEASEDEQLWSNTYDRALSVEEIFDIQADIAERIAGSLETQLTGDERRRIEDAPTDDLASYDAYLQGRSQLFRTFSTYRPADAERSVQALQEAVRRDSSFAEAYAWLGLAYASRPPVAGTAGPWLDSASAAIERARKIKPDLPAAHLAQARIHSYLGPDSIPARIASLRRALELQPSHALAKSELSEALAIDGQYVEAVQRAHEAVQLAPRQPVVLEEMADQLTAVGLYDASNAWYQRLLKIEPDHLQGVIGLADTLLLRGRPDQALQIWEGFLEGQDPPYIQHAMVGAAAAALAADRPERARDYLERPVEGLSASPGEFVLNERRPRFRALHGLTELRVGNRDRGRQILQETANFIRPRLQRDTPFYVPTLFTLAGTQAALGRTERALERLEQMQDAIGGWYLNILTSPLLDELRSDPRFQKIVREFEARREEARKEIRQLDIDLYPPGAGPDSVPARG